MRGLTSIIPGDTGGIADNPTSFLSDGFVMRSEFPRRQGTEVFEQMTDKNLEHYVKRTMEYQGDEMAVFRWFREDLQYDFDFAKGEFDAVRA